MINSIILSVLISTALSVPAPAKAPQKDTDPEMIYLAKTVYGEAIGLSDEEMTLVCWCVFQRISKPTFKGLTIKEIVTAKGQFYGYLERNPVKDDILAICEREWEKYKGGDKPPTHELYAPTLPYYFFTGRKDSGGEAHNYFREGLI